MHYGSKESGGIKYFNNNIEMQRYFGGYLTIDTKICEYRISDIIKHFKGLNVQEAKKEKREIFSKYKEQVFTVK